MRQMRFELRRTGDEHPLRLKDAPIQDPGYGQILLKNVYCGVCHTDLHIVEGDIIPSKLPIVPGHQAVGRVEGVGPGVIGVEIGDRVGVPWLFDACGSCDYCHAGMENLCDEARFAGFDVDGGFAEYMLADHRYVLPIPDGITDKQAAPLLCAGIIGYRSLKQADVNPGERVGLFGFGASAHLTIQVAGYWDCEVYVFTRSDEHRRHAEDLGAIWVGRADEDPPQFLDRAVIFAPVGWMVPKALRKIRPAGTLAINAIHMSPIPEMPYELIYKERTLRSVANATFQDGVEFLQLAEQIPINPTVNIFDLEEVNEALGRVKESSLNGEAVLRI